MTIRSRLRHLAVALVLLVAATVVFQAPLVAHGRAALLIAEEFPQVPLKPLTWLTLDPTHTQLHFDLPHGAVVADLFTPVRPPGLVSAEPRPAMIFAMGVKTQEKDKPIMFHFAQTLSRLGYAVFWPRLEALDQGESLLEDPETFIAAFEYLEGFPNIDRQRISMLGFSVGSSIALVAAEDPRIADRLRGLVFFGGYYDLLDYLLSQVTQTSQCPDGPITWIADEGALNHSREVLTSMESYDLMRLFTAANGQAAEDIIRVTSPAEIARLNRVNPAVKISAVRTRVFILHDKGDHYVPYCESLKLDQALRDRPNRVLLITDIFEHVQPAGGLSWPMIADFGRFYRFLGAVFAYA